MWPQYNLISFDNNASYSVLLQLRLYMHDCFKLPPESCLKRDGRHVQIKKNILCVNMKLANSIYGKRSKISNTKK